MFETKIIVTLIVMLFLIAGFLGTNDTVKGFFGSFGERISLTGDADRDIFFELSVDNYSRMEFSAKTPVNLTVYGLTTASLRTGNLITDKALSLSGFQGSGSIDGRSLYLDGKIAKIGIPEITVGVQENIKASSNMTGLSMDGIELKELKIHGSGHLIVSGTRTEFSGDIEVVSPAGIVELYRNNGTFYFFGKASKIALSPSGIVID